MLRKSNWERRSVAHSTCISHFKSDKSIFTPWSTPRVLDYPKVRWRSNHKDCMVPSWITSVENTRPITMPISGINTNCHRSSCNISCNLVTAFHWYDSLNFKLPFFLSAIAVLCCVRVWSIQSLSEISDIIKSFKTQSSVAPLISVVSGAVNQLLLA